MSRIAVKAILSVLSLTALASVARADYPEVRFVPPTWPFAGPGSTPALDPVDAYNPGNLFDQSFYPGGNSNDGYSQGRGIVFTPDTNFDLRSVGTQLNVRGASVSFLVALAGSTGPGSIDQGTVLRSGIASVTTGGMELVNFVFDQNPVTLLAGQTYHVQFQFTGNPVQNLRYDTRTSAGSADTVGQSWNQGGTSEGLTLSNIRATLGTSTFTTAAPITLNFIGGNQAAIAPEPGTIALLGVGIGLMAVRLRRRRA